MNATKSIRMRVVLVAAVLAALLLALATVADPAEARKRKHTKVEKVVFTSARTSGEGVNNPTGDLEIFIMNPDGTELKQLTFNTATDDRPILSPDGQKVVYRSLGVQSSNPEGDQEIYVMNVDGTGLRNLTNNSDVAELRPDFSPDGKKIAYESSGARASNPEGDFEIYSMNAADGSDQQNLTNTASGVEEFTPDFSPSGNKIAYETDGAQPSNPEGDTEIYAMSSDGSGQRNLTNTASDVGDFESNFGKAKN